MTRLLWPRILYWLSFAVMLLGLFYALTGINNTPATSFAGMVSRSTTQTGGAIIATFALIGMMLGKVWMDRVVRLRSRLPCAQCGTRNSFTAMHCSTCGMALRAVHSAPTAPVATDEPASLGVVCQTCGMRNAPSARFCSSCAKPLHGSAAVS